MATSQSLSEGQSFNQSVTERQQVSQRVSVRDVDSSRPRLQALVTEVVAKCGSSFLSRHALDLAPARREDTAVQSGVAPGFLPRLLVRLESAFVPT